MDVLILKEIKYDDDAFTVKYEIAHQLWTMGAAVVSTTSIGGGWSETYLHTRRDPGASVGTSLIRHASTAKLPQIVERFLRELVASEGCCGLEDHTLAGVVPSVEAASAATAPAPLPAILVSCACGERLDERDLWTKTVLKCWKCERKYEVPS